MKVSIIGFPTQHELVGVIKDSVRRPIVVARSYAGAADLLKQLLVRVAKGVVKAGDIRVIAASPSVKTFALCRKFLLDSDGAKKEASVWRIEKVIGQTEGKDSLFADLQDDDLDLLILEIPPGSHCARPLTGKKIKKAWAVVKTEDPTYLDSPLFHSVNALVGSDRQIVVMSVNTLRRRDKTVFASALSWESTADSIRAELRRQLRDESSCEWRPKESLPHAVVISVMNDGAAYALCRESTRTLTLVYDPKSLEGEWVKTRPGKVAGHTQCLVAAIAAGLVTTGSVADLGKFVRYGLSGGRRLHEVGYLLESSKPFPTAKVVKAIRDGTPALSQVSIDVGRDEEWDEPNWSILKQAVLQGAGAPIYGWPCVRKKMLDLLKKGFSELSLDVPVVPFEKLTAVLREEIEGLRSIGGLMREYSCRSSNKRPLSIAVFGAPGSGKSFAVNSVAKSIREGRKFTKLEFNLSQFSAPNQLYGALHQVRDCALSGDIPLVFWDEFDCDFHGHYGWLRYFLAPMQDGKFTEGETTHSVGNAVFIFAGGTSHDIRSFRDLAENETAAKGPDFLSRLHGFLNIANLRHDNEILLGGVLIRRAILLRSFLSDYAPGIGDVSRGETLDIDDSVATAFLCIPQFEYGARSMEAILSMSNLVGKNRFEASSLPPSDQIDLHVNSSDWFALLKGTHPVLRKGTPKSLLIGW